MEYTVDIEIETARKITERALFDVAAIGGVSVGAIGGRTLETTLTVEAPDMPSAIDIAVDKITALVPGETVGVRIMTTAEHDRQLAQPSIDLVGVAEIAARLGVSKQRVSTMSQREDFPRPVAQLAAGPVWRAGDLSTFSAGWRRRPGRPKKDAASA